VTRNVVKLRHSKNNNFIQLGYQLSPVKWTNRKYRSARKEISVDHAFELYVLVAHLPH